MLIQPLGPPTADDERQESGHPRWPLRPRRGSLSAGGPRRRNRNRMMAGGGKIEALHLGEDSDREEDGTQDGAVPLYHGECQQQQENHHPVGFVPRQRS